ncbi:unnamed protein product [Fusarium graminearum]|uniref:Nucleotide-diphospho-sugar transferase domain-containing protein n=1 Tax=Gibberella zeae TaxID=5518 RepID=A0A4E9DA17_GIBZA|nr:hypothetical protein FG05_03242 [Fusarium graminearum]KAI6771297.1 hypothetical protein HG531_008922 [Fusarium graminearum]CAF3496795.1 unnamed protein product [Fusarium graminearum]CAF3531961.1 unnamed protein product [Fusarium graminearum]
MTVPRSNRAVVLAAVVFITIFLGLAHFHLKTPSETAIPSNKSSNDNNGEIDEPAPFIPEKEAAAVAPTFVPAVDEGIGGAPAVETVTEVVEVEPTPTPTPPTAADAEAEAEAEHDHEHDHEHEHEHKVTPQKPDFDPEEAPSDPEELAAAEAANTPTPVPAPSPADEEESFATPDELSEAPALPETVSSEFNLDAFTPEKWIRPAVKVNDPEYYPYGHWPSKLPSDKPIWNEPLGKKLCIVDLESRRFDKPGYLWSNEMTWNKSREVHGPSGGTLNHWVYAKIHGYQYYHIKINSYPDRRDSWKKPSVLAQVLKKHDVCVFIDSDALFNRLDLPLEWLMNYWSITPQNNSMALPFDPDTQHNRDRRGNLFLNTGFMIMQNKKKTYEIFKEWDDCANDGGRFPGCTEFRNRKGWQPTDQGGFGTFIRYAYDSEILSLPCTEANGFPESNSGCDGKFIKHVWIGKEDRLVQAVGAVFPGVLLETFHKQFLKESESFKTSEDELIAANGRPW